MSIIGSVRGIGSVAKKEFLHVLRDRRILVLIILLPPLMTFIFGHAFEQTALTEAPALLQDRDRSVESRKFVESITGNKTFAWKEPRRASTGDPDLLQNGVQAAVIVPPGWGRGLANGNPLPLRAVLDGADTNTADQLQGALQAALGDFQMGQRQRMVENLPDEVIELGEKLPVQVRKQFVSAMEPWSVKSVILYNPQERFIDYVTPGIIGLILQLLTVTLTACTITREREAGTLSQMAITCLRRREIIIGKVLPYLAISMFLIASTVAVAWLHFHVHFRQPLILTVLCMLFLLCSLGLGLLISAFCNTQTQAIQIAVFFLLPVFPLSGAFAPLDHLPDAIQYISQTFPLTHFCHAFRLINLYDADFSFIVRDLCILSLGALVTCAGAAGLLSRAQD